MPWPLKLLEARPLDPEPGDLWPRTDLLEHAISNPYNRASMHTRRLGRAPLALRLGGEDHLLDRIGQPAVTGEAPNLTLDGEIRTRSGSVWRVRDGQLYQVVGTEER